MSAAHSRHLMQQVGALGASLMGTSEAHKRKMLNGEPIKKGCGDCAACSFVEDSLRHGWAASEGALKLANPCSRTK